MKLPSRKVLVRYIHWRERVLSTMKWIIEAQKAELAYWKAKAKERL
jgi:hypothetical protein